MNRIGTEMKYKREIDENEIGIILEGLRLSFFPVFRTGTPKITDRTF